MGWRDHLLRLMARGILAPEGWAPLDTAVMLRVLDRVDADPELAVRLDTLDEEGVRSEFLALYREEEARES